MKSLVVAILAGIPTVGATENTKPLLPIPDKLVVLTFDDGAKSDITFVAPLLKRYGFGATFFITEGLTFLTDKQNKLTWQEIRKLHDMGFEIGNHSASHPNLIQCSAKQLFNEVEHIESRCREHGIDSPKTFGYPGDHNKPEVVEVLRKKGYLFARRGVKPEYPISDIGDRGPAYNPCQDDPLLIPCTGVSGPNWPFEDFVWAVEQARDGKISVLCFHGVPDNNYSHCTTPPAKFARFMKYLHDHGYTVIAMRDLTKYVDPAVYPADPYEPIYKRLGIKPVQLKCEYAVNPLGIDTAKPRFSWLLESTRRDQKQAAYQILVAGSEEKLKQNIGDLWDSGKVVSDKSVNTPYQGRTLTSSQKCWWKLRVWNKPGYDGYFCEPPYMDKRTIEELHKEKPSDYSTPATFEMGLLKQSDWQGKWISADKDISSPLFRKEFEITKKIISARAYFSGLGWGELYINGKKVSDDVLSPAFTDYFQEIKYRTYDVTDLFKKGTNAIGIMLGNGWFSKPKLLHFGNGKPWSKQPQAILQVNVTYDDQTQQQFFTDDSWKFASGAIGTNDLKIGEHYDARAERPLWSTVGCDESQWKRAVTVASPGGRLTCQIMPSMKIVNTLKPIKLSNPKKGVWVFEFDRFFSGWTRLNVKGKAGDKIRLAYASRILDNGFVAKPWPGGAGNQTDVYTLKGDPDGEVYEPRFTLHPVRYVQISGLDEKPTLEMLMGCEVYNDVDMHGNFTCSNELFNQIHKNTQQTLKIALKDLILDAVHRELIAYNEPASISAALWTRKSMPNLWTKAARDIKQGAAKDGTLLCVVPRVPDIKLRWDNTMCGNYPMLVWYLYQCYDDQRLLDEHYQTVKAWVNNTTTKAESNHIVKDWLGDHMVPGDAPGDEVFKSKETPAEFVATCFYYHNTRTLSNMAGVLSNEKDQRHYAGLAQDIRKAINDTWLDRETGHYSTQSQTVEILALAIGVVPKEYKQKLIENISRRITEVNGGKLRVGHAGLPGFLESLVDNGMGEIMCNAVNHREYPGWGYMVSHGATTIWETWSRDRSKNNYPGVESMTMLAGIVRFFYSDIAGIGEPDFYGARQFVPGYGHIVIKPHVLGDLTHANASIKTVKGIISSSWKKNDNIVTLKVTIPVNSQASISVPKTGLKRVMIKESDRPIWKNGKFLKVISGITSSAETKDYVTFETGSGSYKFVLNGQK